MAQGVVDTTTRDNSGVTGPSPGAHQWILIFSSSSDAPRVRWRTDLVSAIWFGSLLLLLALVAGNGSSLDGNALRFVGSLPG